MKHTNKDREVKEFLASSPVVQNDKLTGLANREETQFLSLILQDKDLMTDAVETGIMVPCFQHETTRKIFSMAAEHFDRYNGALLSRPALEAILSSADTPEEAGRLKSQYDGIVAEFGLTADDYGHLKNDIEARYLQRQAYAVCQRFADELLHATRNQKEIVARLQNYVGEIAAVGEDRSFFKVQSATEVLQEVMKDIEARRDHPERFLGIRSGFGKLDADYNGFVKQRYMVITATEGGGKSTLMLNLARNFALMGNTVVYVTIESTNVDIGRRVLTMQTKVDYNRIMRGGDSQEFGLGPHIVEELRSGKEFFESRARDADNRDNLHFIQVLENTHRETICRLVQRVRAYKPVDVVFIDYLQVVGKEVNFGERVDQAIADVSGKFRAWGRKNNVLLVTAQQIKGDKGRKLQEKLADDDDDMMIVKGDTSSSKEISGSADYMFGCWIPRTKDRMVVWSTKTRLGKDMQKYVFTYDADSGRIEEMGVDFGAEEAAARARDIPKRDALVKKLNVVPGDIMGGDEPPNELNVDDIVMGGDSGMSE